MSNLGTRFPTLGELTTDINTELRVGATNARYTTGEVELAIRRAINLLSPYFFVDRIDTSKSFATSTFNYVYAYPVSNVYRVHLRPSSGPDKIADDVYPVEDEDGTTLYFLKDHTTDTIVVFWEQHPIPFPNSGLVVDSAQTAADLTIEYVDETDEGDWPDQGFFKVGNEIFEYSAINRTANTFTVVRGRFGTTAVALAGAEAIDFVNPVGKEVFYDGVRDLSIAYLNRMRLMDAPTADVAGNVTVMRQILDDFDGWIRAHRMRSKVNWNAETQRARPLRSRSRSRSMR